MTPDQERVLAQGLIPASPTYHATVSGPLENALGLGGAVGPGAHGIGPAAGVAFRLFRIDTGGRRVEV